VTRFLTVPAGRTAKFVVFAVMVLFAMAAGSVAGKFEDAQENETSSFLPGGAESVKALDAVKQFPSGEVAYAVTVIAREDGRLGAAEQADAQQLVQTLNQRRMSLMEESEGPIPSEDGQALLVITPVRNSPDDPDPFLDSVDLIRDEAHQLRSDGVRVEVTGAAGYGADAIKVFGDINGQLLLAAGGLVLILLILIYRSPIFWAIPFFTVLLAEVSSRGIGYLLSEAGVTINGQTGGILPVLVFGAGTDYALLLVSRYREELRRHDDKHEAMRIALRTAGPAIVASGLTVMAALLVLLLADVNSTAGIGPIGAMGVGLAMVFMLTMLPAALTIFGRRAFWPFIPYGPSGAGAHGAVAGRLARFTHQTDETHGTWRRVGERVAERPRVVATTTIVVLLVMCAGFLQLDTGLTNGNSFRGEVEAVKGNELVAAHFPAGANVPSTVIVPRRDKVEPVIAALKADPAVADVGRPEEGPPGTQLSLQLNADPYSTEAFDQIPHLRDVAKRAGGQDVLIGGPTAESYDYRKSAARDNKVIIPVALVVVFLILAFLLRALLAPAMLVATNILSFAAALGLGIFFFQNVFGYPGEDPSLPVLSFVFLVALGIDYNIFLMARVREETFRHGTREGMLRGLAVTGAVITSAGIVLAGTFSALAVLPLIFLTEIGFVIAVGVLLDTFVVRSIVVPALTFSFGPRIWWPSRLVHEDGGDRHGPGGPDARKPSAAIGNGRAPAKERITGT
jgi:putative drug exporter of the RND superfamily